MIKDALSSATMNSGLEKANRTIALKAQAVGKQAIGAQAIGSLAATRLGPGRCRYRCVGNWPVGYRSFRCRQITRALSRN